MSPLSIPVVAMAIFVTVFAVATLRKVHLGVLMFPAACGTGVVLAGMPLKDVVAGFPVSLVVLLVGVTYFFGVAQVNGTIDRLIAAVLARVGARPVVLPFVFFALTAGISAMGSPLAGLVLAPVAMPVARRSGVDAAVMAIAINSGISAGAFAPTSLFGIVCYGTARQAGIDLNPFALLAVSLVANLALLSAAFPLFGPAARPQGTDGLPVMPTDTTGGRAGVPPAGRRFDWPHIATLVCMGGLVAAVIASALAGIDPDIGVIAFAFGAVLSLIDPAPGPKAVAAIDWSTVLMVGGIITFVGVLQKVGAVDLLAHAAQQIGTPLLTALVICMIAALASAFASTTGILAALVPLAVPLATSGAVSGWALISSLGVCASIVDASPFSTTGATLVASAAEDDRARLRSVLLRWGLAMVIVGPAVSVTMLAILGGW